MVFHSLFIIGSIFAGVALGLKFGTGSFLDGLFGAGLMFCASLVLIWLEYKVFPIKPVETVGSLVGFSFGLILCGLTSLVSQHIFIHSPDVTQILTFVSLFGFCYLGTTFGFRISQMPFLKQGQKPTVPPTQIPKPKILDTSAIIDGRIADLCQTGFLEGPLIVPQFILFELHRISDSADTHKRLRGKRGLDILHTIQNTESIDVNIVHDDFPQIPDVDSKLVALAKQLEAKLITTDMNLNKVASLQGIQVLNANDVSKAIRPVVIPGESLRVFLLREGKEAGQGVAHLDDGTMVVVDHAKRWIGKYVEVVVTSVIQTSAGRMIFSSVGENTRRLQASFG
ncbi:PIN/TRAM domain-containing protein [Candidatus Nitronereus thalassa]|uniref:TRAM domain-containing protein n=1 Tax=Candidatus Nitronereus thalassa TaxID=3020898 RepID=A0ABU3K368_9BACT|nr:TRAM domain-containing protein [Candidatus Nitronereus thalassa]MDT7040809.1 TRAM domain-containing protein [Candidatus Nitronereus thalassa]